MGNYEDLKAALATATSEADQLNGELTASKSQVSALQAQVGDLEEQLADCQGGTPVPPEPEPSVTTVFGSSDNANVPGYAKVASARKYYSGQIGTSWKNDNTKGMVEHATDVLWVSFKALPGTGTNTPLEQFLKSCSDIPLKGIKIGSKTVKVMVTIFHEPENDGSNKEGHNLTEYNNAYAQARPIIDRYAYAALGPVRMNSQPADKNNKYWPTTACDFDGWDCYYQGIQCPKNYDQTGAQVYAKVLASKNGGQGLTKTGKPLAIGETGIGRIGTGSATDPKRIQRAKEMRTALINGGAILGSWWNAKNDDSSKCSNPTGCQFVAQSVADAWFKG